MPETSARAVEFTSMVTDAADALGKRRQRTATGWK
jgi:hypothetical protein